MWAPAQPQTPMTPLATRCLHRWPALTLHARPLDDVPPPLTAVAPLSVDPRGSEPRKASLDFIMNGSTSNEQSRPATAPAALLTEWSGETSGGRSVGACQSSSHAWEAWEVPIKQECVSPSEWTGAGAGIGVFSIGPGGLNPALELTARGRQLPPPPSDSSGSANRHCYALPPIDASRRAAIYNGCGAEPEHALQRIEARAVDGPAVAVYSEQQLKTDRPQECQQYQYRQSRAHQYDPHDHHQQQQQQLTRRVNSRSMTYEEKRRARECKVDGCRNYIINKGLCFRHGVRTCINAMCALECVRVCS